MHEPSGFDGRARGKTIYRDWLPQQQFRGAKDNGLA